jgi:hypothetical protein
MCNTQARAERCYGMTKKDLQYGETNTIPIRVLPIIQMTWIASRKRGDWNDNDNAAPESRKAATSKNAHLFRFLHRAVLPNTSRMAKL